MCHESSPLKLSRVKQAPKGSFTLAEMLVAIVVLVVILGIIFALTQETATVYKQTSGQMEAFRAARNAFETMTRQISLATLNNYYDYTNSAGSTLTAANATTFVPVSYALTSNLHFICGKTLLAGPSPTPTQVTHSIFFQAPLGYGTNSADQGLGNLLNACGYYVQYTTNTPPSFLPSGTATYRYRLMEFIQPTEGMTVYTTSVAAGTANNWFTSPLAATPSPTHVLADNIIALIVLPRYSIGDTAASGVLCSNYEYDTRAGTPAEALNQLPPLVEVVLVAIDEASALKMGNTSTQPAVVQNALHNLFQTASVGTNPDAQLNADLTTLEAALASSHIHYLVFQTNVPLRGSKLND